jgi:hypothetical protein
MRRTSEAEGRVSRSFRDITFIVNTSYSRVYTSAFVTIAVQAGFIDFEIIPFDSSPSGRHPASRHSRALICPRARQETS